MKRKKRNHSIFDRAYDKAARLGPGDRAKFYPLELTALHRYLYRRSGKPGDTRTPVERAASVVAQLERFDKLFGTEG